MKVLANVVSYGLGFGAALCLTVALGKLAVARLATRTPETRMERD
jgi:hypothetical protein